MNQNIACPMNWAVLINRYLCSRWLESLDGEVLTTIFFKNQLSRCLFSRKPLSHDFHFAPSFFLKNSDRTQSVVPMPPTRYYWLDFLLWNHKREISNFSQLKMKETILPDISKMAMSCDEYFQGDLWYDILESFAVQKIKNEQQMSIQQ